MKASGPAGITPITVIAIAGVTAAGGAAFLLPGARDLQNDLLFSALNFGNATVLVIASMRGWAGRRWSRGIALLAVAGALGWASTQSLQTFTDDFGRLSRIGSALLQLALAGTAASMLFSFPVSLPLERLRLSVVAALAALLVVGQLAVWPERSHQSEFLLRAAGLLIFLALGGVTTFFYLSWSERAAASDGGQADSSARSSPRCGWRPM